jgi:hypothetical protein
MRTWEEKVEQVVGRLAQVAWQQANFDRQGKRYKKTRQYTLPDEASALVDALGWHDRRAAEFRCKEIMEGLRLSGVPID